MNAITEERERLRWVPTYANQIWHARNLLAEKGMDALYNPHAATGRICGCGSCFCCAALEVYNAARYGQAKIYWKDLRPHIKVRFVNRQYVTPGNSLVYWMGSEVVEANAEMERRLTL